MAIPAGSALGYVLGERIATSGLGHWGAGVFGGSAESWRWAFYLVVVPGILLGAWSFFMHEPPRGQADLVRAAAPAAVRWRDYSILLRTPSYVFCTLGMAAMTFAIGGIAFWMPFYLKGRPGTGSAPITTFGAIVVVAGIMATYLGGLAGDKLRGRFSGSYLLVSGVAMFVGFPLFLAALKAPFPLGWVLIFLACFCLFFNTGPTNTVLANVTHPAMRAAGFALNIFVIHTLGDVLSPVVIGILSDKYQPGCRIPRRRRDVCRRREHCGCSARAFCNVTRSWRRPGCPSFHRPILQPPVHDHDRPPASPPALPLHRVQ